MAKKQDNRSRVKPKASKRYPKPGRGFNYLDGADRDWAKSNRFDVAEYCVGVKGGNRFSGSDDTKLRCGDGRSGFSTRRAGQDEVNMEIGADGQYKKRRSTLVKPSSARCAASRRARRVDGSKCGLVTSDALLDAMRDPIVVAQQRKVDKKSKRARNRNNKARRGHKQAIKVAA